MTHPSKSALVKTIVLACSSNDENFDGGLEYAAVALTPQFCKLALERLSLCAQLHAQDSNLLEMYYWTGEPTWFGRKNEDGPGLDETAPELANLVEPLQDWTSEAYNESVTLPHDFIFPEGVEARSECDQMVVGYDGHIQFMCYPKHTSVQITTKYISRAMLEEVVNT